MSEKYSVNRSPRKANGPISLQKKAKKGDFWKILHQKSQSKEIKGKKWSLSNDLFGEKNLISSQIIGKNNFRMSNTVNKFLAQYGIKSILALLFLGIFLFSCAPPLPISPNDKSFCNRDDECPLNWICRHHSCQRPLKEMRDEALEDASSPQESAENHPEQMEEEAPCLEGEKRRCFTGKVKKIQGICKAGEQICHEGHWGPCQKEILPQKESCNGKDDDCDGLIDNIKGSSKPLQRPCRNKCGQGYESCYNGTWQNCTAPLPNVETCNGKDDDCDGLIDNHLQGPLCQKQQGVCAGSRKKCGGKKGWLPCTDDDYRQYRSDYQPKETLCDGKDNDCDGQIDPPPCLCHTGETQSCYSGPSSTQGQGPCRAGKQRCLSGHWGKCVGEIAPTIEQCNDKDDDCDGLIDNKTGTQEPLKKACRSKCGVGFQTCHSGQWSPCSARQPTPEQCNNKDDDCNGKIDDGLQKTCRTACGQGIITCHAGHWSSCSARQPAPEQCNNKDDDCDGYIDNVHGSLQPLTQPCKTACGTGKEFCRKGSWVGCTAPKPSREICDGKDNNCNGQVDEGCACQNGQVRSCGSDLGRCKKGRQLCINGHWDIKCDGEIKPRPEQCNNQDDDCDGYTDNIHGSPRALTQPCKTACGTGKEFCFKGSWLGCTAPKPSREICDGKDNDCDGQVDEGCACQNGQIRSCGSDLGRCKKGRQLCINGRWDTQCKGEIKPRPEQCNNQDDDCDGYTDNIRGSLQPLTQPCKTACGLGKEFCRKGSWVGCTAPKPSREICDGKDNNCNGQVDEGCACQNGQIRSCGSDLGRCKKGQQRCINGRWDTQCKGEIKPRTEQCNNQDDDCDGYIDNVHGSLQPLTQPCKTACGLGKEFCRKGSWVGCTAPKPSFEICDGRDNDCDGQVDEGCYLQKASGRLNFGGFLPALSSRGTSLAILGYDGAVRTIQLPSGKLIWTHRDGMAGGVTFSNNKILVNNHLIDALLLTGNNSFKVPTIWFYQQTNPPSLLSSSRLQGVKRPSEVVLNHFLKKTLILDPLRNKLITLTPNTNGNSFRMKSFGLAKGLQGKSCSPSRLISHKNDTITLCSGYSWVSSFYMLKLLPFPTLAKQQKRPLPQHFFVWLQAQSSSFKQKSFNLPFHPIDADFLEWNKKRYLLISGIQKIPPRSFQGKLWIQQWPPNSSSPPLILDVPARSPRSLTQPMGLKATQDGSLFLAIQEYDNTYPFKSKGGRFVQLSASLLLQKQWRELQSLPALKPPRYLAITPDKKYLALISSDETTLHYRILKKK